MDYSARSQLFDFLVTKDLEPEALNDQGKSVTDRNEADLISFDYTTDGKNYGTVVLVFPDEGTLDIYYGDNLGRAMEPEHRSGWYDFLGSLKTIANRNLLNFQLNNINRLKYTMQGMSAVKEGLFESFKGKGRVSFSEKTNGTRIRIDHSRDMKEDRHRHRAINRIYLETDAGERFLVPSRSLMHAKMLQRHVAEGGTPYDSFGQHITNMVNELATLSRFVRSANEQRYPDAADLIEASRHHYRDMRAKAKRMISQRGYRMARESYDPARISAHEADLDRIREMFITQSVDERIEQALPVLATIKEITMREADEFESWANQVCEGTWTLPDTQEQQRRLQELMAEPLPVGPDATNATEILYDLVGDDELFDRLSALAMDDANADARPLIQQRLAELGIEIPTEKDQEQDTQEDLDADGVLMTRPSNMSS